MNRRCDWCEWDIKQSSAIRQQVGDHLGDNGIEDPLTKDKWKSLKKMIPGTQDGFPGGTHDLNAVDVLNKTGHEDTYELTDCPACWSERICQDCMGSGIVGPVSCDSCGGSGKCWMCKGTGAVHYHSAPQIRADDDPRGEARELGWKEAGFKGEKSEIWRHVQENHSMSALYWKDRIADKNEFSLMMADHEYLHSVKIGVDWPHNHNFTDPRGRMFATVDPKRQVHVVVFDPDKSDKRGVGGFEWRYDEEVAKTYYNQVLREEHLHGEGGLNVRRVKINVPDIVDHSDITDWIDENYDVLDDAETIEGVNTDNIREPSDPRGPQFSPLSVKRDPIDLHVPNDPRGPKMVPNPQYQTVQEYKDEELGYHIKVQKDVDDSWHRIMLRRTQDKWQRSWERSDEWGWHESEGPGHVGPDTLDEWVHEHIKRKYPAIPFKKINNKQKNPHQHQYYHYEYHNEAGQRHREDGPALEYPDGRKEWWLNGLLHRTDGPAVESSDGLKQWWLNGKIHRTDGPAVEYSDGTKQWYQNNQRHRTDGPAVEDSNGERQWWLNGIKYWPSQDDPRYGQFLNKNSAFYMRVRGANTWHVLNQSAESFLCGVPMPFKGSGSEINIDKPEMVEGFEICSTCNNMHNNNILEGMHDFRQQKIKDFRKELGITAHNNNDDEFYVGNCPACGDPMDYCRGHGDGVGSRILEWHDQDFHDECHENGCDDIKEGSNAYCDQCAGYGVRPTEDKDPRYPGDHTIVVDCNSCKGTGQHSHLSSYRYDVIGQWDHLLKHLSPHDPRISDDKWASEEQDNRASKLFWSMHGIDKDGIVHEQSKKIIALNPMPEEQLSTMGLHLIDDHGFDINMIGDTDLYQDEELLELHENDHQNPEGNHTHNPEVLRVAATRRSCPECGGNLMEDTKSSTFDIKEVNTTHDPRYPNETKLVRSTRVLMECDGCGRQYFMDEK